MVLGRSPGSISSKGNHGGRRSPTREFRGGPSGATSQQVGQTQKRDRALRVLVLHGSRVRRDLAVSVGVPTTPRRRDTVLDECLCGALLANKLALLPEACFALRPANHLGPSRPFGISDRCRRFLGRSVLAPSPHALHAGWDLCGCTADPRAQAAFSVANFILSPFYGRAADSMSIKKILLFSNVWELAGNALYLFANDVYTAVEARFIAGMGAAAGVCVFAYVAHISDTPQELNALMGLVMASRAIGLLMGPAFNVLVVNMDFTVAGFHVDKLNGPGLLMVIVWFLCQLVLLFFFKDVPRPKKGQRLTPEHPRSPTPSIQGSDDVPEEPISWREYLNFPVVAVVTLQFIQMFNQTAYETWLTPFTNVVFVFNQLENSIVYMSTAVIGLFTWFLILCFT